MDKPLIQADVIIDKGKTSLGTYVSVFIPSEDVDSVMGDTGVLDLIAAQPDGDPVEVVCDICLRTFTVPASMAPPSDAGTRYYQMCPDHSAVEQLAFIRSVRESNG